MAETTKNKARRVCKEMGIKMGRVPKCWMAPQQFGREINPGDPVHQHALAMLCVAEGKMGVWARIDGKFTVRNQYLESVCTKDQLIRTIFDVYLEG